MRQSMTIEHITPVVAGDLLALNKRNRAIRTFAVNDLADAMKRGEFEVTTDAIGITASGDLLNGQHRLLAVIQSGVAIDQLVIRGLPDSTFDKIDVGVPRTIADNLRHLGVEQYAGHLGSVLLALWRYQHYSTYQRIGVLQRKASREQLLRELLPAHPRLMECIPIGAKLGRRFIGAMSMWALLYYQITEHDPSSDEFFEVLLAGENLQRGNPVFQLRERLSDRRIKIGPTEIAALTIKAWRLWRQGKEVLVLAWHANKEEFPRIDDETNEARELRIRRERERPSLVPA